MNHEELLRDTLRGKADEALADLSFAEIREAAAFRRRHATRRAVLMAAAVVLVVGAPTAYLVRPHDHGTSPSPSTTTGTPTPTPSVRGLAAIPQGRAPGITYLQDGTVHFAQGGTALLPAGKPEVNAFAPYHGGWLVATGAGGPEQVSWYDRTGARKSIGLGGGHVAVSADGARTAYPQSGAIHIGFTSGSSTAEQTVPGKADEVWPVGFLGDGALVYQAGVGKVAILGAGTLPHIEAATAVSAKDDLVAGLDPQSDNVVVSRDGQVQWTSTEWFVGGFSADGRYAAAENAPYGGPTAVAILDARTGRVIAQHAVPGAGIGIGIGPQQLMDVDGSLLVAATDGNLRETVLRLDRDGTLSRATRVFPLDGSSDATYVVFAARP